MCLQTMKQYQRNYIFTWNNYPPDVIDILKSIPMVRYVVGGYEIAPTTGTKHIQGFISFDNARSPDCVRKILKGCHVEVAKYTKQAIEYCKKTKDYFEIGEPLSTTEERNTELKLKYEQAVTAAQQGEFGSIDASIMVKYAKNLYFIYEKHLQRQEPMILQEMNNYWIWGKTGVGKSKYVNDIYPGHYRKQRTKWWDNYNNEDVVVIEELGMKEEWMGSYLKEWADRYPFNAEYKGGSRTIRPKTLIVISNYTPELIWCDQNILQPLQRKFKIMQFTEDNKADYSLVNIFIKND